MKKTRFNLYDILPRKITARKGALTEHQSSSDSGILDPNRLLKAIMYPYDWEKVFPGIRTTMSRWEYCILRYFSEELNETNWSNVLHNLSRNMRDFPESRIYRHTTSRYTRTGLGPGSRSNLRKNARNYSAIFKRYFGPFTQEELVIGGTNLRRMRRFAKALIRHGRKGRRVLEKSSRDYHQIRKIAAKAMFQILHKLNDDNRYQPPRSLWKKLQEERQDFVDDLAFILKFPGALQYHPAFWRLALASATTKVLYGLKFSGEENSGEITIEFAGLVLKLLRRLRKYNQKPEVKDSIEAISTALAASHSHYKAPLQHFYEVGGRELIIQNFRFPTWLNLCRQSIWAEGDSL